MKKIVILLCLILVAAVFLVYQIQLEKSYFLIVLGDKSIEMNLWFAVGVFLLALFIGWLVIKVITSSVRKMYSVHEKVVGRSEKKAQLNTTQGLIAFFEGDWSLAHKKLVLSARNVPAPIINYLAAAQCAHETGDQKETLALLEKAERSEGVNEYTVALAKAKVQLSYKQYEQALSSLLRAKNINPDSSVVLRLQKTVYVALEDWSALKKLLPLLHKKNVGTLEDRYHLERVLCQETVKDNIQKNTALANEQRVVLLEGCVNNLPAHFRKDSTVLTLYINTLVELKSYDNAAKILARNINREWNDQWVRQYGLLPYKNPQAALVQAESWLKQEQQEQQKERNAVLQLTLGRLCLQNEQWGRAKDFFLSSLALHSSVESHAELARLQTYLGEEKDSQQSYRQGLLNTAGVLLDVPAFV